MLETAPPRPATEPPGRRRRRSSVGFRIFLALLLLAATLVVVAGRYYVWCRGASGPQTPVRFVVPEGASGSEIADALHEAGVLRCGLVSRWLLRRSDVADDIRAGAHELTTNMTPDAAFAAIASRPQDTTVRFTIPEGYRLTEIAARAEEELGIPAGALLEQAESGGYSLPPYLPKGKPLEGFLFPETYRFSEEGTTAGDVIERMLLQFRTETVSLPWQNAERLGVTPYEIVTIASMIEEEAKVQRDRPLVAAVIYNRLRLGMRLQVDPTVGYIDPNPADGVTASDYGIWSPYNTYRHTGLPPTPISSPGLPSLRAALNPADVDYLYYVLCGADGHHAFSTSFAQHERNIARCLG
ncbi:MAG: endolytic transglycosylase MltG [Actinomycetota bacterium]